MALDDFNPEPGAAPDARPEEVNPLLAAEEDEDLFDFPPVVAFADEETEQTDPVVKTPPAFLDEFDGVEADPPQPTEEPAVAERALEEPAHAAAPPSDDLPLDAGLDLGDGPVEDTLRRISELESDPEPVRPPAAPRTPAGVALGQPVQVVAAPAPSGGGWTKVALVAAAAILLLEIGIVGAMWQTNRSFVTALLEVRAERESAPAGATAPIEAAPSPVTPEVTPGVVPTSQDRSVPPPDLPDEDELALSLADEEIQSGQFEAARRRLRRLLATIDRVDERRRDRVAAEAAYRLAETYRLQAEAMEERR